MPIRPCKMKELGNRRYRCYFELALSAIGGKWKPIILYHLGVAGVLRFGELRKGMSEITEKMLTQQLRELEKDGLVHREVYPQVPPKVEYSLTEFGETLLPLLLHMREWGVQFESHLGGEGLFNAEEFEAKELPPDLQQRLSGGC